MASAPQPGEPWANDQEELMSGTIICGVDDSESAKGAARVARGLSSKLGLGLMFVRVAEPGAPDERIRALAERLARLSKGTADADSGAGWLVDVGHPADRLVAVAADEEASMIVVGSTGPRSSLLGSVSAEVSRRASCPVVVVPPGGAESSVNESAATDPVARRTGFPGLSDDGYAPARIVSAPRDAAGSATDGETPSAPKTLEVSGGIVRFGLGERRRERQ
jgi:nucleotide-binding universal stress UspA family protein